VTALLEKRGEKLDDVRTQLENDVRYANITIIEGHDASQYGIGIVSARIAEMVLRDERAVVPIGSYQHALGVTLSLPSIVGRDGVVAVLQPDLSPEEQSRLEKSTESLKNALRTTTN
jgi:L-lactate dehydrogenase